MDRVYVANLPPDIRIKDIDDFFRPFGKLVYIDVNHRANPVYAFVQFDSARNAFNAVKSRHGYDYEGYTLQLRLVENEVRKRREATPPPPPPPIFGNYERENSYVDYNSNSRMGGTFSNSFQQSSNFLWPNNSRYDMQQVQQNTSQYPVNTTSRFNMSKQNMVNFSTNNRSSSSGRMNMQQQFYNTNRSSMQQQYSNSNRTDMPQQNMNYINSNLSNMPQQNINTMDYSNYSAWANNSNRMDWNSNNYNSGIEHNNMASNETYKQNSGPRARPDLDDNYTRGLSGSGRKWFNRYIRRGFSREMARAKALEHRTVPYLREDRRNNQVPNNSTNAALENIGTTLLSLLNTNQVPNYNNNWGGENLQGSNFDIPGPSSSSASGGVTSQPPCNAVSRKQYLKSLDILKKMRGKREQSAKDRISRKYHTQIVKDYEQFKKMSGKSVDSAARGNGRADGQLSLTSSETKLSLQLRRKKRELLLAAKRLGKDTNRRYGGAYKKRFKILMNEAGFSELEAKALAIHPIEKLKSLMSIKKEYDMVTKKTDFIPTNKKVYSSTPKEVVYRNDIKYLAMYEKQRLSNLSPRIKSALIACLTRVHKFEKGRNLPLTRTKFTTLLQPKSAKNNTSKQERNDENKQGSSSKRPVENDVKTGETASVKVGMKQEESENLEVPNENPQKNNCEENLENQDNEGQHVDNEKEEYEVTEDPENNGGKDQKGESASQHGDE